jgi:hypothetical protein
VIGEATDSDAQQVLDLLISEWPNFDPDEKWVEHLSTAAEN